MANVAIQKNAPSNPPVIPATPARASNDSDPVRMMRHLLRWDPFGEMIPVAFEQQLPTFTPAFEVKETKDGYTFKADVPGVRAEDLDITVTGNRLSVTGHRNIEVEDKADTYFTYERSYGSFLRAFTLPDGSDPENVKADLRDGVLTLILAKKPEMLPRKVALKAADAKA